MDHRLIKESIIEKALTFNVPTQYSDFYDNLPESFKAEFRASIDGRNFGLPTVIFRHSNGDWIIIGTREIAWKNHQLNFVAAKALTILSVPQSERQRAKQIQPERMIRKFEYEVLELNTHDGRSYPVYLNKGKEYYVFWHLIIRLSRLIKT